MQYRLSRLTGIAACAGLFALSACQWTGEGAVELSPFAAAGYREYSEVVGDKAFALTEDGRSYGYAYCIDNRCTGNEQKAAMANCERGRKRQGLLDTTCKIFARNDVVLWNGDVSIPDLP